MSKMVTGVNELKKGTSECNEQCHTKGCNEEIALACTCNERGIIGGLGMIIVDKRKGEKEEIKKIPATKTEQETQDYTQTIQLSLAQTMNERGEFGVFKRFDI